MSTEKQGMDNEKFEEFLAKFDQKEKPIFGYTIWATKFNNNQLHQIAEKIKNLPKVIHNLLLDCETQNLENLKEILKAIALKNNIKNFILENAPAGCIKIFADNVSKQLSPNLHITKVVFSDNDTTSLADMLNAHQSINTISITSSKFSEGATIAQIAKGISNSSIMIARFNELTFSDEDLEAIVKATKINKNLIQCKITGPKLSLNQVEIIDGALTDTNLIEPIYGNADKTEKYKHIVENEKARWKIINSLQKVNNKESTLERHASQIQANQLRQFLTLGDTVSASELERIMQRFHNANKFVTSEAYLFEELKLAVNLDEEISQIKNPSAKASVEGKKEK